ncbi:MAG TPA: hypothetical protein DCY20_02585 [Firmicutes bacterium]|nr:hypothetical protein [Bacillota bacterium]
MTQKLILPFRSPVVVTAGYKCSGYTNYMKTTYNLSGMIHYGLDSVPTNGNKTIYGSGKGEVIAFGEGKACGKVVVVRYDDVYNHVTKSALKAVAVRYFHLDSFGPNLKVGMAVTTDTVLGVMGGTGTYGGGSNHKHLHCEVDTNYAKAVNTPTLKGSDGILKSGTGTDTTFCAANIWHAKTAAPYNQKLSGTIDNKWVSSKDVTIPSL